MKRWIAGLREAWRASREDRERAATERKRSFAEERLKRLGELAEETAYVRQQLNRAVLKDFGENPEREHRAVLVRLLELEQRLNTLVTRMRMEMRQNGVADAQARLCWQRVAPLFESLLDRFYLPYPQSEIECDRWEQRFIRGQRILFRWLDAHLGYLELLIQEPPRKPGMLKRLPGLAKTVGRGPLSSAWNALETLDKEWEGFIGALPSQMSHYNPPVEDLDDVLDENIPLPSFEPLISTRD